jgi:hypothetical protein
MQTFFQASFEDRQIQCMSRTHAEWDVPQWLLRRVIEGRSSSAHDDEQRMRDFGICWPITEKQKSHPNEWLFCL